MKTLLALDISLYSTGWACFENNDIANFGCIKLPEYYKNLTHNNLLRSQALYWFCKQIHALVKTYEPNKVCAEEINIKYIMTMRSMAEFHAAASIGTSIWNKDIILEKISNPTLRSVFNVPRKKDIPSDIKKLAKKYKVNETKIYVSDTVRKIYGLILDYKDNDITDAIGIGHCWLIKNG